MAFMKTTLIAAAAIALAACSTSPRGYLARPAAPSAGLQPAVGASATSAGVNSGGTYPYGTASTSTPAPLETAAGSGDGLVVVDPDGNVWIQPEKTDARYQADVESCYSYAQAQIDHDVRIENDINGAFQSSSAGFGLTELRGRMNNYERRRRRPALFSNCMVAKGYIRQ
jgi:hypothetical protein